MASTWMDLLSMTDINSEANSRVYMPLNMLLPDFRQENYGQRAPAEQIKA